MATIKTAISMNKYLFEQAEELAQELQVSRSRLFVLALEEFIQKNEYQHLLEQLNSAYEKGPNQEEKKVIQLMKEKQRTALEDDAW